MRSLWILGLASLLCIAAAPAPDGEQDAALAQLVANVERCERAQAKLAELEARIAELEARKPGSK